MGRCAPQRVNVSGRLAAGPWRDGDRKAYSCDFWALGHSAQRCSGSSGKRIHRPSIHTAGPSRGCFSGLPAGWFAGPFLGSSIARRWRLARAHREAGRAGLQKKPRDFFARGLPPVCNARRQARRCRRRSTRELAQRTNVRRPSPKQEAIGASAVDLRAVSLPDAAYGPVNAKKPRVAPGSPASSPRTVRVFGGSARERAKNA